VKKFKISRVDWILLAIISSLFLVFLLRLSVYERQIIPPHVIERQDVRDIWYVDLPDKLKLDTQIQDENIKGSPRRLLGYMSKWRSVLLSVTDMPRSNLFTLVRDLHRLNEKLKYENATDCFAGFVAQFIVVNNEAIQAITSYLSSGSVRDYKYMLDTIQRVKNDADLKIRTCQIGR